MVGIMCGATYHFSLIFPEKVGTELDRLIAEGVLKPVAIQWLGRAIVPLIEPEQSVNICGAYKLTINEESKLDC